MVGGWGVLLFILAWVVVGGWLTGSPALRALWDRHFDLGFNRVPPWVAFDTTQARAERSVAATGPMLVCGCALLAVALVCLATGLFVPGVGFLAIAAVAAAGVERGRWLRDHPERWRIDDDLSRSPSPITPLHSLPWPDTSNMSVGAVLAVVGIGGTAVALVAALLLH
jgi:hypothetical protein